MFSHELFQTLCQNQGQSSQPPSRRAEDDQTMSQAIQRALATYQRLWTDQEPRR